MLSLPPGFPAVMAAIHNGMKITARPTVRRQLYMLMASKQNHLLIVQDTETWFDIIPSAYRVNRTGKLRGRHFCWGKQFGICGHFLPSYFLIFFPGKY